LINKIAFFQHHIHTNDVELDPDIAIEFYVRLNPTHPLLKFQVFQYFYFFVIIAFYGLLKVYLSIGKTQSGRFLKFFKDF
jgi:fatty acid desaturase